jgi:hypothetical protein
MRIKSYFAPSVQSAIALARHEFGDHVTLVTSHVAAPDARHLGEYEVVFAVEETADAAALEGAAETPEQPKIDPAPESAVVPAAKFTAFQEVLLEAVAKKPAGRDVLKQIGSVRLTLIELGIEPPMVRALMTLVEREVDASIVPEFQDGTAAVLSQLADSLTAAGAEEEFGAMLPESLKAMRFAVEERIEVKAPQRANLTAAELAFVMSISEVSNAVRL